MNPEALIALLKELFGAAPSSAEALKNIGEMGAEAGPGLQRLFRGEQAGAEMGRGQLFTKDIKDAASFAKKTGDSPTLHALDVPENVASRGNIADSKGFDTVGRRSIIDSRGASPKRAENSSFVVKSIAENKKKIFPAVVGATGLGMMSAHQSNAQGLVDENGQALVDENGKPMDEGAAIPPAGEPRPQLPEMKLDALGQVQKGMNALGPESFREDFKRTHPKGGELQDGNFPLDAIAPSKFNNMNEVKTFLEHLVSKVPGLAKNATVSALKKGESLAPDFIERVGKRTMRGEPGFIQRQPKLLPPPEAPATVAEVPIESPTEPIDKMRGAKDFVLDIIKRHPKTTTALGGVAMEKLLERLFK